MADFTSSLYLGMLHATADLQPWDQLTTGRPAALGVPAVGVAVAREVARLQECERATLRRSTLHAFWDLFGSLPADRTVVLMDGGAYPVVQWGLERAAGRGIPTGTFPHHDAPSLRSRLGRVPAGRSLPVVVTDGFCPGCGGPAPLVAYRDAVRERGGLLVLDDTQAFGILGQRAAPAGARPSPYGQGGGGSVPWAGAAGPEVVVVTSLAKGLGAPLATIAGSGAVLAGLEAGTGADTTVYTSPPSMADLHAADRALGQNRRRGEWLRARLTLLVLRLRRRLAQLGITAAGGSFPVQSVAFGDPRRALAVQRRLLARGVRTVVQRPRCRPGALLTFIVTTRHRPGEIDAAAAELATALEGSPGAADGFRL